MDYSAAFDRLACLHIQLSSLVAVRLGGGMGNPFLTLIHFYWRRANAPIPKNIHLKTAHYGGSSLRLLSWVLLHDGLHPGAFQVLQS